MPLITGTPTDDLLPGTDDNDTILGLGGNDTILASAGTDSLDGGLGDGDTASYATISQAVSVQLEIIPGSADGLDSLGNTLVGFENVTGSAFGDDLTGSTAANLLNGGAGDDQISGGDGADTLIGGTGSNLLDGGNGTDTASYSGLAGPITANLVDGNVTHGADSDTLIDIERVVATAATTDTLDYSTASTGVSVQLEIIPGSADGLDSLGNTLVGFENVTGSAFGDDLTGSTAANLLNGGAGDDQISGGDGADTLIGGTGSNLLDGGNGTDTASYSGLAGPITANLVDGNVTHGADSDTLIDIERVVATAATTDTLDYSTASTGVSVQLEIIPGSADGLDSLGNTLVGFENVTGSAFGDDLTGSTAANLLNGGAGDDQISGGDGADTLIGGTGSNLLDGGNGTDTASYSGLAGPITANLVDGNVTHGADSDTLIDIERVVATAATTDTLDYSTASTGVSVQLEIIPGSADGLDSLGNTLVGFENVTGSAFGDDLTGSTAANLLNGGAGDDQISGGDGADTLIGGTGSNLLDGGNGTDTASYSGLAGPITANLVDGNVTHGADSDTLIDIERVVATAATTDTLDYSTASTGVSVQLEIIPGSADGLDSLGNTLVGFENVTGSAFGDDLTGSTAANLLNGGAGDDQISGGDGADTLIGGTGSNLLDGGNGTDTASYSGLAGPITANLVDGNVTHGADSDTLIDIERVVATAATTDTLDYSTASTGVSVQLEIIPGSADGLDSLGNTLVGFENVTGSAFGDDLTGSTAANLLNGGAGDDQISGGDGADTLIGGTGSNLLDGGNGTDTASYSGLAGPITANLVDGNVTHGADSDTLIDIERVVATAATTDTLDYSTASTGVSVQLEIIPGSADGLDSLGNTLVGFENVTGSAFGDDLTGSTAANLLNGGAGDDQISGGDGADTLIGGTGSNLLDGGNGTDTASYSGLAGPITANLVDGNVTHGADSDTLIDIERVVATAATTDTLDYSTASTGVSVQLEIIPGSADGLDSLGNTLVGFENVTGSAFGDDLTGSTAANLLNGGAGDDQISGGDGADTLIGGTGSNLLDGGNGTDTASYSGLAGPITANLVDGNVTHGADSDTLIDIERVVATAATTDTLDYSTASTGVSVQLEIIPGSADGLDSLGNTLVGFENVTGSAFGDDLTGSTAANLLNGGAGDDQISGGDGADTLIGGTGSNLLDGGNGTDTASYSGLAGPITANLVDGNVTHGADSDTLIDIERVVATAATTDTLDYSTASTGVSVQLEIIPGSADGLDSLGNTLVGFENVTGSAFGDDLTGSTAANLLNGGAGDDQISGGDGADTLIGGTGSNLLDGGNGTDTASYSGLAGPITANLVDGNVTHGADSDTLIDIENLIGSEFGDFIVGTAGANSLSGAGGNDTLISNGGTDTLDGGSGYDIVDYRGFGGAISVDLDAGGSGTGLEGTTGATLISIEGVIGTAFGDDITGNAAANYLVGMGGDDNIFGGDGDDTLFGGTGDDLLDGGAGEDLVDYRLSAGGVVVNLATHSAIGDGTDTLLNIEHIVGSLLNDSLTGDDGDNFIYGFDGDDILAGGFGNDTLDGGAGNNTVSYAAAATGIIVDLPNHGATGDGTDALVNVQNIIGSSHNDFIIGDAAANHLEGGSGNDTLAGGDGFDTLDGGDGQDLADFRDLGASVGITLNDDGTGIAVSGADVDSLISIEHIVGTLFGDEITGNVFDNFLYGNDGADVLSGAGGNDTLVGGEGEDTLIGGIGDDVLTGGTGADAFTFEAGSGHDWITDFTGGVDHIDLVSSSYAPGTTPTFAVFGGNLVISIGSDTITLAGVTSFDVNDLHLV